MKRRLFIKLGSGAALGSVLSACGSDDRPSPFEPPTEPATRGIVIAWNNTALAALRATRMAAPMAARAMAIVHSAMYDGWAAYDGVALGSRLGAQLRRPVAEHTPANRAMAMSFAAYTALIDQFPTQKAQFEAHLTALRYAPSDAFNNAAMAPRMGVLAARAVLEHAHADGANQLGTLAAGGVPFADYSGYVARNPPLLVSQPSPRSAIPFPGLWQPLQYYDAGGVLRTQSYLVPFWGTVRPFALSSGSQFRPPAPAAFGSIEFAAQAEQLVRIQGALSEEQKVIADFWAGGRTGEQPGSYWCQFAQLVSVRDGHDDDDDVKLFFALANAVFDAGIAAWDAKRAYDSGRPLSAIRYLMNGRTILGYGPAGPAAGLKPIAGDTWMPLQLPSSPTPAFPDHVSGNSTFSAAAAEVLRRFTGSDVFRHRVTVQPRSLVVDPTLPAAPVTLAWDSFSALVAEAGISRLYAGIHFERASVDGRVLGEKVGTAAFVKARGLWRGHP